MTRDVVIVDLDDTLAASWRREHLIQESWDAFHADCVNDDPIHDMTGLIRQISNFGSGMYTVIGVTGRNEKFRGVSQKWLLDHDVPLAALLMRPDGNYSKTAELKIEMLAEFLGGKEKIAERVAFVIDDNEPNCQAFSALGVTILQIYARRT
jgi:hypothetical protein